MTVFFTEKTSFCDFLQVYAHSGLKFTWQMYLQHLTLRSKFEVFTAQPLPKLATATSYQLHLCFPPTEFKYYHEKSIDYYIAFGWDNLIIIRCRIIYLRQKKRIDHVQNLFAVNNYCQVKKSVSCICIIWWQNYFSGQDNNSILSKYRKHFCSLDRSITIIKFWMWLILFFTWNVT